MYQPEFFLPILQTVDKGIDTISGKLETMWTRQTIVLIAQNVCICVLKLLYNFPRPVKKTIISITTLLYWLHSPCSVATRSRLFSCKIHCRCVDMSRTTRCNSNPVCARRGHVQSAETTETKRSARSPATGEQESQPQSLIRIYSNKVSFSHTQPKNIQTGHMPALLMTWKLIILKTRAWLVRKQPKPRVKLSLLQMVFPATTNRAVSVPGAGRAAEGTCSRSGCSSPGTRGNAAPAQQPPHFSSWFHIPSLSYCEAN